MSGDNAWQVWLPGKYVGWEASIEWKLQLHRRVRRSNQGTDGTVRSSEIPDPYQVGQHKPETARMAKEVTESEGENIVIHF